MNNMRTTKNSKAQHSTLKRHHQQATTTAAAAIKKPLALCIAWKRKTAFGFVSSKSTVYCCVYTVHTIALKHIEINIDFQQKKKRKETACARMRISGNQYFVAYHAKKKPSFCILISIHLAYGFLARFVWSKMAKMCRSIWKICKLHLNQNSTAKTIRQCFCALYVHFDGWFCFLFAWSETHISILVPYTNDDTRVIFLWSARMQMHSVTVD